MLKAIDIFSGCGGATLGLKLAGFKVVAAIESDPAAATCYRVNHPEVTLIESDIRSVSDSDLRAAVGRSGVSLVAGCPPCQGFSRIRTRNYGPVAEDNRNSLYLEFIRVVRILKPTAVMLENVPYFAKGSRFLRLCRELRALGYELKSGVLDVADYDVPQRRNRLLLVGLRGASPRFADPLLTRQTLRQVFGRLKPKWLSGDPLHTLPHKISEVVKRRISGIPKDGGCRSALPKADELACHQRTVGGFNDVYGRMSWDDVAPTITAGVYTPSKGRFLHPEENRCISLREAAVIQAFPPSYVFPTELGKMKLASLIGNALPPEFIRRHALELSIQLKQL